jgi:hypothetical protein
MGDLGRLLEISLAFGLKIWGYLSKVPRARWCERISTVTAESSGPTTSFSASYTVKDSINSKLIRKSL